jgi:isochorismate synthase
MHLSDAIKELLRQNRPFVCYRLPGDEQPLCVTGTVHRTDSLTAVAGKEGFVVVPFLESSQYDILFFELHNTLRGWEVSLPFPGVSGVSKEKGRSISPPVVMDYETYSARASHLLEKMRLGSVQKVVLSRAIRHSLENDFNAGKVFQHLCMSYHQAFVYIFNDGDGQCWMGASPEILLQCREGKGRTVSLAGTQAAAGGDKPVSWESKETEEQELVSQYLRDTLKAVGIKHIAEGPLETLSAGPIVHLFKRFDFDLPEAVAPLQLAQMLHPTPAVCGLPAQNALKLILESEPHQRAYYCGFLGPVSNKGQADLFVNLRCMQLFPADAYLYVGGGLLAESNIESEWDETVKKAETLLSFLQKKC